MQIAGLTKLSLVDFPGKVCAVVFLAGCNFACPFCHNAALIPLDKSKTGMAAAEVLEFLRGRKNMLDGVCVSGGEPLLSDLDKLTAFLTHIKALNLAVKLDTNGSNFAALERLSKMGLADYVAMDAKAPQGKFARAIGAGGAGASALHANTQKSLRLLLGGGFPEFELRTTVVGGIHTPQDIGGLAGEIAAAATACGATPKAVKYYLQTYSPVTGGDSAGLFTPSEEFMRECLAAAAHYLPSAVLRG